MDAHLISPSCSFCQKMAKVSEQSDLVYLFEHSAAFLGSWQYYQGYCVLVSRRHATELSQLDVHERRAFLDEMCELARAIEEVFQPHKLNYELLGNQVPHLHWHVFPRYVQDSDHLRPVWLALDRADRDEGEKTRLANGTLERREIAARLRRKLQSRSGKS